MLAVEEGRDRKVGKVKQSRERERRGRDEVSKHVPFRLNSLQVNHSKKQKGNFGARNNAASRPLFVHAFIESE